MTLQLQDLAHGLQDLGLGETPVIAHASLKSFGEVEGGAATVAEALSLSFPSVLMPVFTYKTMVTPGVGPAHNAMVYGTGQDANRMAQFYSAEMPADPLMGAVPEALRLRPQTRRSDHPILSFAGLRADAFLAAQTMEDPFGPIGALEESGGWVLLLGVNHTVNTSIHYAEKRAGRKTFTRWALTPQGVRACPAFPGCSAGFEDILPEMENHTRRGRIGQALVQAMPLTRLFKVVMTMIKTDPLALLCQQEDCERCRQIEALVLG